MMLPELRKQVWKLARALVHHRLVLSVGLSIAAGIVAGPIVPIPNADPVLEIVAVQRPLIWRALGYSYHAFLFTTPFLLFSMVFSLLYVHFYDTAVEQIPGRLPKYPDPAAREDLYLLLGEVHEPLEPAPSIVPRWYMLPEQGLYTGIAVVGAIGSGKTQGVILPAMRQLFGYRPRDPDRKLSGIVLEVKGDLCRQLSRILEDCGREHDYIEVSLDSNIRYNPLNNSLEAYAQAFHIASIITSIWGRGKEPFWQQSYTDLVRYVIILHRVNTGYVTLVDVYRTVISAGALEGMLVEAGRRVSGRQFVGISPGDYLANRGALDRFRFSYNEDADRYIVPYSYGLSLFLMRELNITAAIYAPKLLDSTLLEQYESVNYWYWEHWKYFRHEVKSSIIQGIAVFLSLFETDPKIRRVFCPPREVYEDREVSTDPDGRLLPPFEELIEEGRVVGLNFPVAMNPALAKTIGTMMKSDYQRAVELRIPKMESTPDRHYRPTVFICDEYQAFATVGGDNPLGDERFFSLSRQPKCIPIVATQSVSSLKESLPNEGFKTLIQTFRTKVFLATSDPDTARFASELCGKTDKTKISYSVSEASTNANVGWLSGRTSSNRGTVSASKSYKKSKEPLFEERAFFELQNAQSIVIGFDGVHPMPATYCYLKPDFLPVKMTWFEQEQINFNPDVASREVDLGF